MAGIESLSGKEPTEIQWWTDVITTTDPPVFEHRPDSENALSLVIKAVEAGERSVGDGLETALVQMYGKKLFTPEGATAIGNYRNIEALIAGASGETIISLTKYPMPISVGRMSWGWHFQAGKIADTTILFDTTGSDTTGAGTRLAIGIYDHVSCDGLPLSSIRGGRNSVRIRRPENTDSLLVLSQGGPRVAPHDELSGDIWTMADVFSDLARKPEDLSIRPQADPDKNSNPTTYIAVGKNALSNWLNKQEYPVGDEAMSIYLGIQETLIESGMQPLSVGTGELAEARGREQKAYLDNLNAKMNQAESAREHFRLEFERRTGDLTRDINTAKEILDAFAYTS